jgi:hypothetical protein
LDIFSGLLRVVAGDGALALEIERTPVMKFPKKVFVYTATESNGTEYLCVARDVEDIPEDVDREMVATYKLKRREQFVVRRILK